MNRTLVILGLVSLFWAAAIASSQFQRGMGEALKTRRITAGVIPALAATPGGGFQVVPVQADGTLPPAASEFDFYLTDEQISQANASTEHSLWLDSLETHNSRRGRTVKLTLRNPAGVTISIYEGAQGKVIPQQAVAVRNEDLTSITYRALGRGAAAGLLSFVVLWLAMSLSVKRTVKNDLPPSEPATDG